MQPSARMFFAILLLVASGCSRLVRERLADSSLPGERASVDDDRGAETGTAIHDVSVKTSGRPTEGSDPAMLPPPRETWLERQQFIFARAWQEMCRDMNYESIDSFQELTPEANREVRMMREDLAGAGGTVTTTRRRGSDR